MYEMQICFGEGANIKKIIPQRDLWSLFFTSARLGHLVAHQFQGQLRPAVHLTQAPLRLIFPVVLEKFTTPSLR